MYSREHEGCPVLFVHRCAARVFMSGIDQELYDGDIALFCRQVQTRVAVVVKVGILEPFRVGLNDALDEE